MATVDTRGLKMSVRDLIYLVTIVVTITGNYYMQKADQTASRLIQDKVNAVTDLQLQTIRLQIEKLEADLKDLKKEGEKK